MRAVSSEFDSPRTEDSFIGVLDQFAALRAYADAPAVGGYRLLGTRGTRTALRQLSSSETTSAAIAALARARMRLTGFFTVLFVGGLGLAVLAGPATCPCTQSARIAERSLLTRLGYAENASLVITREREPHEAELPQLAAATVVDPEPAGTGVSPITTSALEPSHETLSTRRDEIASISVGRLPAKIVEVSDVGPTVRLASVTSTLSDVPETLPVVEVTTPPMTTVTATEAEAPPESKLRVAHRKHTLRAYRTPTEKQAKRSSPGNNEVVKRAPRWAQQMYVTPWQSQAFSYTR